MGIRSLDTHEKLFFGWILSIGHLSVISLSLLTLSSQNLAHPMKVLIPHDYQGCVAPSDLEKKLFKDNFHTYENVGKLIHQYVDGMQIWYRELEIGSNIFVPSYAV